jgi:hypothetical protein
MLFQYNVERWEKHTKFGPKNEGKKSAERAMRIRENDIKMYRKRMRMETDLVPQKLCLKGLKTIGSVQKNIHVSHKFICYVLL